ncbi:MAG: hypothetical protein ABSG85_11620 [Spirochaetia bacterium]
MFERNEPVMTVPAVRLDGLAPVPGNVTVASWSLSDLAYLAIRESNDFAPRVTSVHDLVALCNELTSWDETVAARELRDLSEKDTFLRFAVGFPQKQFWYQQVGLLPHEFCRQVELLEKIPTRIGSPLNLDEACRAETGLALRHFRVTLIGLLAYGIRATDMTYPTSDGTGLNFDDAMTLANMKTAIDYYTTDYTEARDSPNAENHFFMKPLVKSSTNKILNVNQFILARKATEGPFWAIREYYRKVASADFMNEFGKYFEQYVLDLLNTCLRPEQFERIPEKVGVKTADWIIHLPKYRLLVEQKAGLAALSLKRLYPKVGDIKDYLSHLAKGVRQLDVTEQMNSDSRVTIKLLVHYETLYLSDGILRPATILEMTPPLASNERIFFLDISEFEWLVSIVGQDQTIAEAVIEKKLERESSPGAGREFYQVIPLVTEIKNTYVMDKIDHWHSYIPGLSERIRPTKRDEQQDGPQ